MQSISIDRTSVNIELLDSELKSELPNLVVGTSTGPNKVVVHLDDNASKEDIALATQIVKDHDETLLTDAQYDKQELDAVIQADRDLYSDVIIDAKAVTLEQLAERVKWLENEIRDLRGL